MPLTPFLDPAQSGGLSALGMPFFIIQLNGCMSSFCCIDKFMMIVTFSVKLVNNKVVDNLLILLVLKFNGHRPNCLRLIAVRSLLSDLLVLWIDLED